jgi:hypothetical protein
MPGNIIKYNYNFTYLSLVTIHCRQWCQYWCDERWLALIYKFLFHPETLK